MPSKPRPKSPKARPSETYHPIESFPSTRCSQSSAPQVLPSSPIAMDPSSPLSGLHHLLGR